MSTKTKAAVAGKGAGKGKGKGAGKNTAAEPVQDAAAVVTEDQVDQVAGMEEAVAKAEEDLGLAAPAPGETAANIVITPKDEIQGAPDGNKGNIFEQVQAELAAEGASLDENTGEIVENSSTSEGVDRSENQDVAGAVDENAAGGSELVHEVKPDKIGKPFLKYLRVDVPDHRLAEMAKRQAELFNFWNETQVAKKKAAKAYKEDIERTEEELTTIAEVIADGAEEVQISCRWEYDYRHGVKYLRRLDTKEIVDTVTLTPEECQFSFNLDAEEEPEEIEENAFAPAGGEAGAVVDMGDWVRNDERTAALLEMTGVKVGLELLSQQSEEHLKAAEDWALGVTSAEEGVTVPAPPFFLKGFMGVPVDADFEDCGAGLAEGTDGVIGVDLAGGPDVTVETLVSFEGGEISSVEPVLDADRRCCLPTDRATGIIDGVETLYCTVCGLVARKRKENADPWDDDLDFEIGEKVDLAGLA